MFEIFGGVSPYSPSTNIYLLFHGTAREINDNSTIIALGYNPLQLELFPADFIKFFRIDKPIALIERKDNSPDEAMRVELAIINALRIGPNLLENVELLCKRYFYFFI